MEKAEISFDDKLIEQKLKAVKRNNALIFLMILFFLTISFAYMWYIKEYPERIVEVPVEKIVEKKVEKEIYVKEKTYFIWNEMFVKFQIGETKWERKFIDMIKLLSKAETNQLEQKIYINEIYSVDTNWKKTNWYNINNAFTIRNFIKGELTFIEKLDKDPNPTIETWTWVLDIKR